MTANNLSGGKDSITVLRIVSPAKSGLTKVISRSRDGKLSVLKAYGGIRRVQAYERPVSGIGDIADLLMRISGDPKCCIIRGGIRPGFEAACRSPAGVRRLAYDRPDEADGEAAFEPRARQWFASDMDSFELPAHIDPVNDIEHVVDEAIARLPQEFLGASCVWQLTSGHGIKEGARVRLFHYLSRPISNEEATRWVPPSVADPSVHRTVQPNYVAAPIFPPGMADFLPVRMGLRVGETDEVEVPDLSTWSTGNTGYAGRDVGLDAKSVEAALEMMGDQPQWPNGQGFHNPIRAAFRAVIREYGSKIDQATLLAQVESKLQERIGLRGIAYLQHRVRDAKGWLGRLVQRAKEWEDKQPKEPPANHGLPAYYPAPTEPRDAALARQNEAIWRLILTGGKHAAARAEIDRRKAMTIDPDATPAEKGRTARKIRRAVLAQMNLPSRLPRPRRLLVSGAQGSGKTSAALAAVAKVEGDVVVV